MLPSTQELAEEPYNLHYSLRLGANAFSRFE